MTDRGSDRALDVFSEHRDKGFAIAYRMTGSVADAADVCQDAWLRWRRTDVAQIDNPEAWIVRLVTNLAIDRSRSAAARREAYVGPYLPEPVATTPGPLERAELADSLTFAFLVLLDELEPTARAVLLLHDVFGHSFEEVAATVGKSVAACRQIASRTRKRLDARRVELRRASDAHERRMLAALTTALMNGDADAVMALLSPDVVQTDDGGPHRRAARNPVVGPYRVARLLVNLAKRVPPDSTAELVQLNANPAVVVRVDGRVFNALMVEFAPDGRIRRIWDVANPDKLHHLN